MHTQAIAAVLGPALVIVTVSEAIHLDIWDDVHPTVVYLNGLLFLIGGLVIVTTHNNWVLGWGGLVTLAGWLLVLGGVFRMFAPTARQLHPGLGTYALIALLGCLGLALSWFAFLKQ